MTEPSREAVTVARPNLRVAAAVVSLRLDDPIAEQRRLAAVDELLRATSNLSRALAGLARHGLSESRGTHSAWDVTADAEQVFEAFVEYEATVYSIGSGYQLLVGAPEADRDDGAGGGGPRRRDAL